MSIKPTNIPKCHLRKSADSAGNFSRHGKLGEVIENIRTFALPSENQTYTFKMQYEYDSWNRIQRMTYPDGEVVTYGYNRGGMLKSVVGNKNGVAHRYIDSIRYNKFELKEEVYYGNGTGVHYIYDLQQRLSHLRSWMPGGNTMQKIGYTYDSASNITGIVNVATMLPNGLGGIYSSIYTYDNLYRLTGSSGIWAGSDTLDYRTETEYHTNGRIRRKQVEAETLSNGNVSQISYNNGYYYDNLQQPNTLSRITATEEMVPDISIRNGNDRSSSFLVRFSWDATGNMVNQDPAGDAGRRFLCWDEQNRLQGVKDNGYLSYYQYDANGERTYKLTSNGELQNISGMWSQYYLLEDATLYASPYLVATERGYTKHYYAEAERIASRIGGGRLQELDQPIVEDETIDEKKEHNNNQAEDVLGNCLDARWYDVSTNISELYDWRDSVQQEDECYFYHPDHLGSSSWITDKGGHAIQHLHYLPWGEDFVNQRLSGYEGARYTFSAKEKDSETGLSYFGSRYYSSDLSIWLSVDPMSDKYPSLSPYVYCADNPVKLVDPNGEDYEVVVDGNTITIRATYYVTKDAKEGMEMAFNYFTCQDQNLSYTMENGEVYSIRFDLKVVGDYETWDEAYAAASKSGNNYSNVCRIDVTRKENVLGQTEAGRVITIRPDCSLDYRTFAHEIGHTLGFSEWSFELMLSGGGRWDMGLYNEYIQQSMMRTTIPSKATPTIVTSPYGHIEETRWENIGRGYIKTN